MSNEINSNAGDQVSSLTFAELASLSQSVAEIRKAVSELPTTEEISLIVEGEVSQRAAALAQSAGRLALAEAGSDEYNESLTSFQEAMEDLGLSNLLARSIYGAPHERLRHERIRRGLTQEQVAAQMGITSAYLSRIERGERDSDTTLSKIINFFESNKFDQIPTE